MNPIRNQIRLLVPLLLLLPASAPAEDYTYTTNSGAITITGYTGAGGAVTIPDKINGLSVTSIGGYAFWCCFELTSVTIPNSVTNIGYAAFMYSDGLTSVTIPNSVTTIGDYAFAGCPGLSAITLDPSNTAFSTVAGVLFNMSQSTLILCPGGKTGDYTIPSNVTTIRAGAFFHCTGLTSVTIPNSVISIGDSAFAGCAGLTSVTIPISVTSIGGGAFQNCTGLTNVTIPNSVVTIGVTAFYGCRSLTNVTIPNSVTTIGDYAFNTCFSLTNVAIPNSVTNIGECAFACCGLTSVTIPISVTSIGSHAFDGCTGLTSITVDALNPVYSSVAGVLFNKSQTALIKYPEGKVGSYTVLNSVTTIGDDAFGGCTSLTNVTIPNSVTSIGYWAFSACTSLTSVYFQGNAPSLGGVVFDDDNDTTVYYLLGTTGWTDPWGSRPTAIYNDAGAFIVYNTTGASTSGMATDGTNYLVALRDSEPWPDARVMAQLIAPSGARLGDPIDTGRTGVGAVAAYGAGKYLMVWNDSAPSTETVYGQLVSQTGTLVGTPFLISQGTEDEFTLGVAFDGTNFLVAYGIDYSSPNRQVAARFVSPAGSVGSQISITSGDVAVHGVQSLAWNGSKYLVAWEQSGSGGSWNVQGAFITAGGSVSAPFQINQNATPSWNTLSVSSDGESYLVAWNYDTGTGSPTPLWEVHGRIVTPTGSFGSSEVTIAGGAGSKGYPFAAYDGTQYLVTWTDLTDTNNLDVAGRYVSAAGTPQGSVLSIAAYAGNQGLSPVVYGSGQYLVVWTDNATLPPVGPDIFGSGVYGKFISASASPPNPANLAAYAKSAAKIKLLWTDNSLNEDGFEIQRLAGAGGVWTHLTNVAANATAYVDTAVTSGITYYYQVRAFNVLGNSAFSNFSSATPVSSTTPPNAPSDLTTKAKSAGKIKLIWTDHSDNESGFMIQRKDCIAGIWELIATVGSNITTYADTTVAPCVKYKYWVYAYNPSGNSLSSYGLAVWTPCVP